MSKLFWQIFKYGVIGAFATVINLVVAGLSAAFVLPCLGANDILVKYCGFPSVDISAGTRAWMAIGCNFIGFMVANLVCWLLNRRYVFTPGRHSWIVEYALFLAGSGFAIACGSALIWLLVYLRGTETSYSFVINVLASVAINFIVRKFIVFKN